MKRKVLLGTQPAAMLLGIPEAEVIRQCHVGVIPSKKNEQGELMIELSVVKDRMDQSLVRKIEQIAEHPESGMPTPVDQKIVH